MICRMNKIDFFVIQSHFIRTVRKPHSPWYTFNLMPVKKLFLTFLLALPAMLSAQSRAFLTDSLDAYVAEALQKWNIPGVAVAVVKDGKVTVLKGYGVQDMGKPEKVDAHTLFMIGSNSKAFTATAVAMLATEGKCDVDAPLIQYVPEFRMKDPWVQSHASLRDALSHRMGYQTFQGDFMVFDSDLTQPEMLEKFGKMTPTHGFRTTWGYYNTGYTIGGLAIKQISGLSWSEFMQQRIFQPLGMNRTVALTGEMIRASNRCTPHSLIEGKLQTIDFGGLDGAGPAGAISSSVADMSKWVTALLEKNEIISEEAIALTREPSSILGRGGHPFNRTHYELYGMGWFLQDYEGLEIVSHTGGIHGFVTSVTLVPEKNLGIVVLTNTDANYLFEALKWEILDASLDLPYRGYSNFYHKFFARNQAAELATLQSWRDSVAADPKPSFSEKSLEGTYTHEVYGKMTVTKEKQGYVAAFEHHPGLKATLAYMGGNRFLCQYSVPMMGSQALNAEFDGQKVVAITVKLADFLEETTYRFVKE